MVDFGCGPLGALAALSRVVGPSGSVTGVDASPAALAKARLLSPSVQLVQADVNDVALPPCDLAYSRLMLLHQQDPLRTLRNMHRALKPGGVLIAHEPSDLPMHAPASEPPVPAMTRIWELVIGAAQARGATTDFGLRGRSYLTAAGFTVESTRAYVVHYPPEVGYDIPRVALQSLRPTLLEHSLATEAAIAALDAEAEAAKGREGVQWVSSPLMVEWVGRK